MATNQFNPFEYGTKIEDQEFDPYQYGKPISDKPEKVGTQTIIPRIAEDVSSRFKTLQQNAPKQSLTSTLIQGAGAVAGALTDIPVRAAQGLYEQVASKEAQESLYKAPEQLIKSPIGQKIGEVIKPIIETASQHPEATRNVEALLNIASVVPVGKLAQLGGKSVAKFAPLVKAGKEEAIKAGSTLTGTLQKKAVDSIETAYRQAAGATITTAKRLQKAEAMGKDPARFLAERGIVPDIEGGRMRTLAKADELNLQAAPLNDYLDDALKEIEYSVQPIKLSEYERRAIEKVRTQSNINKNIADSLESDIRKEIEGYRRNFGDEVTLRELNGIKKGKWSTTPFDSTKPYQGTVNYEMGRAAKEIIEDTVPKESFSVKQLNEYIGDIYSAEKFLRDLDNRVIKGGRLTPLFSRTIGAVTGASFGGGVGGILGALGGGWAADILQQASFSNPLKQLILKRIEIADPEAYTKVLKFLETQGKMRELIPRLEAPRRFESKVPIEVLPKGAFESTKAGVIGQQYEPPRRFSQKKQRLTALAKKAKSEGYDGIKFQTEQSIDNKPELAIWNIDKIKTKSQLTDIWNKANRGQ